jgi:hypothetical protein
MARLQDKLQDGGDWPGETIKAVRKLKEIVVSDDSQMLQIISLKPMNSSADTAKFRFCESRKRKVVIPIKLPRLSNKPPPEEPGEIGALFCK